MRRITVATISVAASLALAACAERDTTSPRAISAGQASFQGGPNSTSCDFTNLTKAAKNYFTSTGDSVYGIISAWTTAYKTNPAAATSFGWRALNIVSVERLTPATTDGSSGAAFVVMATRCMVDSAGNKSQITLPDTLTNNGNLLLARVLNSGLFEVRTGGALAGPAAGWAKVGGARHTGRPIWGVETNTTTTAWPGSIRYVVYGYPIVDNNSLLTATTKVDSTDDLGNGVASQYQMAGTWPFTGFELSAFPAGAIAAHDSLRVGLCVPGNPGGTGTFDYLIHNDADLVSNSTPRLCSDTTLTLASGPALPWYTRLARGTTGLFKPAFLFAQGTDDSRDFIGGLPSGWSPITTGRLDISQVTVTISAQPKNNVRDSTDNTLTVSATMTNGTHTPVPQVKLVALTVLNNQGQPAGAVINQSNLPRFTDATGHATVTFQIGKPGAYYVVVSTSLDGAAFPDLTTIKFNVKN